VTAEHCALVTGEAQLEAATKEPGRIRDLGAGNAVEPLRVPVDHFALAKKKRLFFRIGPPMPPPPWLRRCWRS